MNLQQAYYELRFENAFLRVDGDAFQDFFEKLMGFAYKADFMACRPWGNRGDRKNDGFLKSERRLFQVYAPNEMTEAKAVSKIQEDFEGAKAHWGGHFDKWVFAHNAVDGLPPHVQAVLLDFEKSNPGITLEPWCLEEFRVVFRRLSPEDLAVWFGVAPTAETKAKLGFKDFQVVLEHLSGQSAVPGQPVKDVPRGKIEANALSDSVATLLREGMVKTPLVTRFFEQWHDPTLGERIAKSFRTKYESLREELTPNHIFAELQAWAGGTDRGTPEHELAILTVMAYYFERCDIFEEPREVAL
ncbi:ABC-three component system protein [Geobacter sp.]|uniref:ABC-three component system protein n=1 Tax=Geobacter sp. TaxID=46610 RepID=UPI0026280FE3|nr:ABC-three component system protein [Geobacter sp.]